MAANPRDNRKLKGGPSFSDSSIEPFPGVPVKYIVTEDTDPEEIRSIAERAGPLWTIRKVMKSGELVTIKSSENLMSDKSDSAVLISKRKQTNEKGKDKVKGVVGKTKDQLDEERRRYDLLGEEDLTPTKNPNRFQLLHPDTRAFVEKAGIIGEEAEKDALTWTALMNSLRFLKIDEGIKFTSSPSKWRSFSSEEEHKLIGEPLPKGFKVQKVLGEGAYGAVYACKCSPICDKPLAVKKLPHLSRKEKNCNLNEITFLSTIPHPTIVKYYTSHLVRDEVWIITEMLEGGPLSQAKAAYDETNIAYAAREILRGLQHLHSEKVVHRDLKSENIMFSVAGDVKLIDFGLAASVAEGPLIQMCGSPFWLSPEMIRMEPHSYPTDIWSFAVSLLEMINGQPPHRDNILGLMYSIGSLREGSTAPVTINDDKWSPDLREFLKLALMPAQEARLSASDLLEHPFLQKACKKNAMSDVLKRVFVMTQLEGSFF